MYEVEFLVAGRKLKHVGRCAQLFAAKVHLGPRSCGQADLALAQSVWCCLFSTKREALAQHFPDTQIDSKGLIAALRAPDRELVVSWPERFLKRGCANLLAIREHRRRSFCRQNQCSCRDRVEYSLRPIGCVGTSRFALCSVRVALVLWSAVLSYLRVGRCWAR